MSRDVPPAASDQPGGKAPSKAEVGGLGAALGAFFWWGLAPLFWWLLRHVDSLELLAHRILWSAVLSLIILRIIEPDLRSLLLLRQGRVLKAMAVSTGLISINWFVFIWAVSHNRVTEMSLGYYANPLLNVLLGRVVLGERLSERQGGAVLLAAAGVAYMTFSLGALPWVSLALAFSFGTYGLVRKTASMPAVAGLTVETTLCAPLCLAYILFGPHEGLGRMSAGSPGDIALILLSGPVTATPLLLFGIGARRLPYSTIGMLQYIAPTLQLACAVLVFEEPFTSAHLVTFTCIWLAVFLYAYDVFAFRHGSKPQGST